MLISRALNPRRIARSLITTLALTLVQTVGLPVIAPKLTAPASHAVTGSITAAGSTTRSFITIPAGVESITLTVTGAGGGKGGSDVNTGGKGGMAQRLVVSFAVTPGDVVSLFPGNAGATGASGASTNTGGTGNGGSVAGGASTVTDSYWNINGTSYQNPSFSGGASGKVGTTGSSGSGGGGGAASVVAINRNIVAVAGGAGGGGGAGSASGAGGTDGVDANIANSNLMYGGVGKDSGAGLTCSASDGGSGGGGGGGYLGGTGGSTELIGTECSGRGGYRGNAYIYNALSSSNTSFDTSANPDSPLNGTITYSYDVKSSTTCTPSSTTTVDIYTVVKFDASVSCTWTAPSTVSVIDIFAVGGGGGGGDDGGTGGGGGAGLSRTAVPINPSSTLTIRVGYGGRGGLFNAWDSNYGETSSVTTSTGSVFNAPGGAGGGVRATGKGAGGSAAVNGTFAGGAGGTYPSIGAIGGVGNYGISNYYFGSINTYAGGGGGGCYYDTLSNVTGAAGRNGGGAGCSNSASGGQSDAISGTAGTGGGGGGGGAGGAGRVQAGKGGSGVILIRYATNSADSFPASLTSAIQQRWLPGDLQILDSARTGFIDSSGNFAAPRTINGTVSIDTATLGTGSTKSFLELKGDTNAYFNLENLPSANNYTLFSIAKYQTNSGGRIVTSSDQTWISGFWQGHTGIAYHNGWLSDAGYGRNDVWALSTDQLNTYRFNGVTRINRNDTAMSVGNTLGINNSRGEVSNWQLGEVLVFNRELTPSEIGLVETYLSRVYGITLPTKDYSSETDTAGTFAGSTFLWAKGSPRVNLSDTFTVEAWVKPTSTCDSGHICYIYAQEAGLVWGITSGTLYYALYGVNNVWEWTSTGIKVKSGEWHHVAISKELTGNRSGSLKFYLDGRLNFTKVGSPYIASTAAPTVSDANTVYPANTRVHVGFRDADGKYFYGSIDEVKVWRGYRSEAEILSDISTYGPTDSPNLRFYLDFNKSVLSSAAEGYNGASKGEASFAMLPYGTVSYSDVKEISTDGVYTKISFPRSYLNQNGGWKVPSNITQVQTVVVGGGGGGGGGYEGGGGGAGGFLESVTTLVPGNIYPVAVGVGGRGTSYPLLPTNGDTTTAFGLTALGGGSGSVEFNDSGTNRQYTNTTGGSGGGGGWSTYMTGASGTAGQGNTGGSSPNLDATACGSGNIVFAGSGGGGAGAVGQDATCLKGGNGGAGKASTVLGTTVAAGGGGSLRPFSRTITSAVQGFGGTGGGGNSAYTDGAAVGATGGATNGTYGTGSGGGAGYASNGYSGIGGNGGAGIIALRYITALVPSYTKPSNAYLNAGMTETFTTNVAVDSATVGLSRTFKWESTTPTSNGAYTTLKVGTGAANAAYSWVPSDTATSGSGYLYRLTVTDSDTAGLFITDSSTAYAIINPALKVTSSAASNSLAKKINVSRNETFTITLGTPTYKASLTPVISGISIDTSTAGSVVLRIGDTATVGTWLETLTVTDSVSATINIPLTITVSSPPQLTNSAEVITNGQVFAFDPSNSASYNYSTNSLSDISGSKHPIALNNGATYSTDYSGILSIDTNSSQYLSSTGFTQMNTWTIETWIRIDATTAGFCPLTSEYAPTNISFALCVDSGRTFYTGFHNGSWTYKRSNEVIPLNTWTHLLGTFDGTNINLYINGVSITVKDSGTGAGTTPPQPSTDRIFLGKWFQTAVGTTSSVSFGPVRLYNVGFTQANAISNYNASKARFDASNLTQVKPSKKYGVLVLDSFTATSGSETRSVTFATGNRAGILWDTTTVTNQIQLSLQESLSAGTYFDTVTVTDNFGQSTNLPITLTVSKADTITVTSGPSLTTVYSVTAPTNGPVARVTGLVGFDTATVTTSYTSAPGSTCATGGSCSIGDIGPGGGYVFYISGTVIDSATGISDGGTYLEVAPKGWSTPGSEYQGQWAAAGTSVSGTSRSVGQGAENTRKIVAALPSTTNLAKVTADLTYNGKSDWFFPSTDEVKAMYTNLYAASKGDFSASNYWGSTQDDINNQSARAETYWFGAGNTYSPTDKLNSFYLRPIRAFTPGATTVTSTPTDVDTYTVTGTNLTFGVGSVNNYLAVVYETSTLKITQANQNKLILNLYGAVAGSPFTLVTTGGSGDGAVTETVTAGSTASNCTVSNHVLSNSNSSSQQFYCNVLVTKASSRNYKSESLTASVYFMVFLNSQPSGQVGSGSTIALNGATSYSVDTTTPPSITSLSTTLLSLGSGGIFTINGTGFGANGLTVKFWRNKVVTPSGSTATTITFNVSDISSAGASTGRITVITVNGQDFSTDTLTITP